jgi:hypothetical protein
MSDGRIPIGPFELTLIGEVSDLPSGAQKGRAEDGTLSSARRDGSMKQSHHSTIAVGRT